ncbi:MAG: hypothetical protein B7X08_02955 [Acidocella sp. 20-63-7]|nr:MAG: hypothetical protein B7X08_02955 [Acidocella sp. 20-63-7]
METEFTRPIRAGHIKDDAQTHVLLADEAARALLAARFGLPGIAYLRGAFILQHERSGIIAAKLHMRATVTQTCVVTLEPFETMIEERSDLRFVPAHSLSESEDLELDAETLEGPDELPYADGMLDLGEALAEQLALALDPYPRKPGAALPEEYEPTPENPFAVLALRRAGEAEK